MGDSPHEHDFARRAHELDRAHRRHRPRRHASLLLRWLAGAFRRPRAVKASPLPPVSPSQVSITFVGHASVLIRYSGLTIALDPMLGERLGVFGLVRRAQDPGLSAAQLGEVDVVLVSSTEEAHLHPATLASLRPSTTVVVPRGGAAALGGLALQRVFELGSGQSFTQGGVDIHTVPAHGDDESALAFVLRGDGPTVFACGSTGYGPSFYDSGRTHRPDLALLPIGGYVPSSFRRRHLSPLDALYAFEDLGARLLVPIGFGTFALSYEQLGEPPRWMADLVAERALDEFVVPLAPGETRLFTNPARARRPTPYQPMRGTDLAVSSAREILAR